MGIHGKCSNFKQTKFQRDIKKIKRRKKQEIKKRKPYKQGCVDPKDVGLYTQHHLKMRRSNPFASIGLSGKQRRRQLKKKQNLGRDKSKSTAEEMEEDKEEKVSKVKENKQQNLEKMEV